MEVHHFNIRVPIWSTRSVGINKDLVCDGNYITIERTNKEGKRDYPHTYFIDGKKAREFPLEPAKADSNVMLFIIPISELTIVSNKKGSIVGKIVLFTGEEIEITHKQYERIQKLIDDKDSNYLDVGGTIIKKTAIANVEDSGEENPSDIDRSPEAVARRQEEFRKELEQKSKEVKHDI